MLGLIIAYGFYICRMCCFLAMKPVMLQGLVSNDPGELPFTAFLKIVLDMCTRARACLTLGQALQDLVGTLIEDHFLLMSTGQT